eukprot:1968435-Rhodomonas_salina.1
MSRLPQLMARPLWSVGQAQAISLMRPVRKWTGVVPISQLVSGTRRTDEKYCDRRAAADGHGRPLQVAQYPPQESCGRRTEICCQCQSLTTDQDCAEPGRKQRQQRPSQEGFGQSKGDEGAQSNYRPRDSEVRASEG